jgi:uncharacterized linocin/CFP29 family protein
MSDTRTGPGWSAAQWDLVNKAVTEAFGKANVAGAFLPCYGPLADSAEYVRNEQVILDDPAVDPVKVEDTTTLKLFNLTVHVELSSEQVNEEGLSSALLAFRRAANVLGHREDRLIFTGREAVPPNQKKKPSIIKSGPDAQAGLVDQAEAKKAKQEAEAAARADAKPRAAQRQGNARGGKNHTEPQDRFGEVGEKLVTAVVAAITKLEDDFHPGPFAAVLGNNLFQAAHTPREKSMVLPADRISPLLKGLLFRCGQLPDDVGVVVSLGGSDIDIVVATPPKAQFLQVTQDAKYRFRVYEKFTWRIKDKDAVKLLYIPPPPK